MKRILMLIPCLCFLLLAAPAAGEDTRDDPKAAAVCVEPQPAEKAECKDVQEDRHAPAICIEPTPATADTGEKIEDDWQAPTIRIDPKLATEDVPEDIRNVDALVKEMFDYWRGKASESTVDMTIHRPDWERTMTIEAWTRGETESLFVIAAPPKDNGNGTLKKGREMWMYNPKVNRVIKLPPSMMSQGWMGSDFSNNDIAKSDSLISDYVHTIEGMEVHDGKKVYLVKSVPKPAAPVVWGMLKLKIREDSILLSEEYYDEDLELVKAMVASEIQMLGDRLFPKIWRMQKADAVDEYTELTYQRLEFKEDLPGNLFTLSNLRTPRK